MGVVPAGDEVSAVVTAVSVCPKVAVPLIVTVPDNAGVVAVAVFIAALRTAVPAL